MMIVDVMNYDGTTSRAHSRLLYMYSCTEPVQLYLLLVLQHAGRACPAPGSDRAPTVLSGQTPAAPIGNAVLTTTRINKRRKP